MVETVLLVLSFLIIITLSIYSQKQYKKGADDLFLLFAQGAYTQKVAMFKALNQQGLPGGTVFVGDSITQDYNVHEFFKEKNVYNRGIGGDTSEGVLNRLEESVFQLKPKTVFLLIGTNDMVSQHFNQKNTIQTIQKIIQALHQFDQTIKINLISILPVNGTMDATTVGIRNNRVIHALNEKLKHLDLINYIDVYSPLLDDQNNLNKVYTVEGLHLNAEGYLIMTTALLKYL
jgi:lysophospholipase L1-like esterase